MRKIIAGSFAFISYNLMMIAMLWKADTLATIAGINAVWFLIIYHNE